MTILKYLLGYLGRRVEDEQTNNKKWDVPSESKFGPSILKFLDLCRHNLCFNYNYVMEVYVIENYLKIMTYFGPRERSLRRHPQLGHEFSLRTQKKGSLGSFITWDGQTKVFHNIPKVYLNLEKRFMLGTRLLVDLFLSTAGKKRS